MTIPHEDFHEIWWIFAPEDHSWGGLRIAHFRKTANDHVFVFIQGEIDQRIGPRDWDFIVAKEGWVKVKRIDIPTADDISTALNFPHGISEYGE